MRMIDFARDLVTIPSLSGEESRVGQRVVAEMESLEYDEIRVDGNGNVIGKVGSGSPVIVFNGHLDHVPPMGMEDPYSGEFRLRDGRSVIWGRGSCDMKANVAAGIHSIRSPGLELRPGHGTFVVVADVREETDSDAGLESVLEAGLEADLGISGEPSGLGVRLGHRGKAQFEVEIRGRSAHAADAARGASPIDPVAEIIEWVSRYEQEAAGSRTELGSNSLTITELESDPLGGFAAVPDRCFVRLDLRLSDRRRYESDRDRVRQGLGGVAVGGGVSVEVRETDASPPMMTSESEPIVRCLKEAHEAETGKPPEVGVWKFGTNAVFLNEAGIPTVGYGAGTESLAHGSEEHVPVDDLELAARVYGATLDRAFREGGVA